MASIIKASINLNEIPKDSGAVVITGRTGLFSGGFDLKTLASGDAEAAMKMTSLGFKTLLDLYSFPRPIVAAVSGHAVALGLFTVCCADIRIGVEGKFVLQANEVRNNMDIPVQILVIITHMFNKSSCFWLFDRSSATNSFPSVSHTIRFNEHHI